ncbi:hypothetical protein D3C80_1774770 [compost metagenome]
MVSPAVTVSPRSRTKTTSPSSSAKVKQSLEGISSQRLGAGTAAPVRMPAWRSRLMVPLRAMSIDFALAVPAPPSSVVTKTFPSSSAVVSSMPTASISSIFIE